MEKDYKERSCYTLGFIKPDGMDHEEEIIKMIQEKGLSFVYWKYIILTGELIDAFYPHVKKEYPENYEKLYNYMKDKLVLAYILHDKNAKAIKKYRDVLGTTKSWEAAPDTVRGKFGDKTTIYKNVAHGSANLKEAQEETIRFFGDYIFGVFNKVTWLIGYENNLVLTGYNEAHAKNYTDEQVLDMIIKERDDYAKKMGQ